MHVAQSLLIHVIAVSAATAQTFTVNISGEGQNGFGPYTASIDIDTTNWPSSCPATGVLQFTAVPPAIISGNATLIDGCTFEVFGDILGEIPGSGTYEWVIQAMFSVEDNTASEVSGYGVTRVAIQRHDGPRWLLRAFVKSPRWCDKFRVVRQNFLPWNAFRIRTSRFQCSQ